MQKKRDYLPIQELKKRGTKNKPIAVPKGKKPKYAPKCSLRPTVHFVYNQGEIGSCTANALAAAIRIHEKDKSFLPSRLWIYFWERLVEDPTHNIKDLTDSGADVVDGESYLITHGVCTEALWPYNPTNLNLQPGPTCVLNAYKHRLKTYARIVVDDIKHYISNGVPVLIAISVYPSFENSVGGKIPIPGANESCLGGHE